MAKNSPDDRLDRPLAELDTTVVSRPLLEDLADDDKREHRIIVEINLLHQEGRSETKRRVTEMIRSIAGDKAVHEKLGSDTDQYVFATMSTPQIRKLARANEADRKQRSSEYETRRLRPIYKIWPDFKVDLLLNESVAAVKADAALAAFAASGQGVVWAVIDSGIDGSHRHFKRHGNLKLRAPLQHWDFSGDEARGLSGTQDLRDENGHGTHVAGIIAGELRADDKTKPICAGVYSRDDRDRVQMETVELDSIRGVAPECHLVSLRVADSRGRAGASNIIAALGYIRRINGDGRLPRIHGVNISLGHPFDPEWFGCGQSPLCVEVDRLVRSGTVVIAAAGNGGYGTVETKFKGSIDMGLSGTIRDPGNANLAITVGSTHRDMPHVYGVSYFSAKGPTNDGRTKPDLVAPGERIISCAPGGKEENLGCEYSEESGTSMAAPHVSGCIAAFMSIRREFKNQPERVREIFLQTATDLGRNSYYQGSGMVDLMRAIQSV